MAQAASENTDGDGKRESGVAHDRGNSWLRTTSHSTRITCFAACSPTCRPTTQGGQHLRHGSGGKLGGARNPRLDRHRTGGTSLPEAAGAARRLARRRASAAQRLRVERSARRISTTTASSPSTNRPRAARSCRSVPSIRPSTSRRISVSMSKERWCAAASIAVSWCTAASRSSPNRCSATTTFP